MAQIDEIKEWIGFLKVLFVTLVAIDTSLIAWFFNHHGTLEVTEQYLILFVIVLLSVLIYMVVLSVRKNVKRLRKL